ncbi:MAG: SDR family NAD(P)-dependent oxidoreductase, partial [Chloroflexi bacterium]|nr:SDR family NAD(P)-dependent oxidoreductase [Chloroflexota bacterium]MCI0726228.1 SDR family NAD(P)-dependent oxidoreductase [Chloroflexota bacterium]
AAEGCTAFVEIGPGTTLLSLGRQSVTEPAAAWLPSLRRGSQEWQTLLPSLAALYVRGAPVDWPGFDTDYARRRLALPTYPFQHERYWLPLAANGASRAVSRLPASRSNGRMDAAHPLLGQRLKSPALKDPVFESQLAPDTPAHLAGCKLYGTTILTAATFLELVLAAGRTQFGTAALLIEQVAVEEIVLLPKNESRLLQTILTLDGNEVAGFQVATLEGGDNWTQHITGKMSQQGPAGAPVITLAAIQERCPRLRDPDAHYQNLAAHGLSYGAIWQILQSLRQGEREVLAEIRLPAALRADVEQYALHPALLEAGFQAAACLGNGGLYRPARIEALRFYHRPGPRLWCHAILQEAAGAAPDVITVDLSLFDDAGVVAVKIDGLQLAPYQPEPPAGLATEASGRWLYELAWQPKPVPSPPAGTLPSLTDAVEQAGAHLQVLGNDPALAAYDRLFAELDALSLDYFVEALRELGWTFAAGEHVSLPDLQQRLQVVDGRKPYLNYMLQQLAEAAFLVPTDDGWQVAGVSPLPDVPAHLAELAARFPQQEAELALLARCGAGLPEVLRGQRDPLTLLFPDGSFHLLEGVYQHALSAQALNSLVERAVTGAIARIPEGQTVRILEIGAGTGGTTSALLPHLAQAQTEYVFTDVSPLFLARAAEKFADYGFVRYEILDIEQSPEVQGFRGQKFDIILAANVLHATSDLRRSLGHVQAHLASGGMLILLEVTHNRRWLDLIFGLTEGWWKFRDFDIRPEHALLPRERWLALLREVGFSEITALPNTHQDGTALAQQSLILARNGEGGQRERWLILADSDGLGVQLATDLASRGAACDLVFPGASFARLGERQWAIDPAAPLAYKQLLAAITDVEQTRLRGIISLWGLETPPVETLDDEQLATGPVTHCDQVLSLLRALAGQAMPLPPRLWLVTRAGQAVDGEEAPLNVMQAPLWGLGKVIALEQPQWWGGLIDLPATPAEPAADVANIVAQLDTTDVEDQVAFRRGQRYVARLVRSARRPGANGHRSISAEHAYLITGGLGGLGLRTAAWLVEQGARHLVLAGRRGLPERVEWPVYEATSEMGRRIAAVQRLEASGATVQVAQVDMAQPAEVARLLAQLKTAEKPLRGIVHAAGISRNQPVVEIDAASLAAVLRPKVNGAWLLHQHTLDIDLDFFVLFSTAAAVWGSTGAAHYAAANSFLDALAHYRSSLGRPALSINWARLSERGMLTEEEERLLAAIGIEAVPLEQALALMADLMVDGVPQQTVAAIDWPKFKAHFEVKAQRSLFTLIEPGPAAQTAPATQTPDMLQRLAETPAGNRRDVLTRFVRDELARVLQFPSPEALDLRQGFFDMGLDSLTAVELKSRLEKSLGLRFPAATLFNYSNIVSLVNYLAGELPLFETPAQAAEVDGPPAEPANDVLATIEQLSDDDVARLLAERLRNKGE